MKQILLIPLIMLGAAYAQNVKIVNPDTQPMPVKILASMAMGTTLLDLNGMRNAAVPFANANIAGGAGTLQVFTDSNTITPGATVAGGGSSRVLAYYDGTNWTVIKALP